MLVYTKNGGKTINPKNFQVIPVPINYENIDEYKNSSKYHTIGIYKEIITNQSGILDRLRKDENNNIKYDIGIAEFNVMAGSFAVFEALGIEETFDVSNSVFNPQYLQFLGINVLDYQVPVYNLAKPGDWVNGEWQKDRDENRSEHEVINRLIQKLFTSTSHDLYDSLFDDLKLAIEKPSTLDVLFKKIKYHFINQHPLIKFNEFPEDDKIVYIGGILVEDDKLLTETKKKEDNESMYAGVPLICIPFTGDQFYNASTIEANGVGVYLKLNDIHFMKNLENSLNQILNIDDAGNFKQDIHIISTAFYF
uniref:glucuronosyltransferase n=1 Tax=Meloidogyne javanica TaxID=6303 RepID=A0A915M8K1_MELJA